MQIEHTLKISKYVCTLAPVVAEMCERSHGGRFASKLIRVNHSSRPVADLDRWPIWLEHPEDPLEVFVIVLDLPDSRRSRKGARVVTEHRFADLLNEPDLGDRECY